MTQIPIQEAWLCLGDSPTADATAVNLKDTTKYSIPSVRVSGDSGNTLTAGFVFTPLQDGSGLDSVQCGLLVVGNAPDDVIANWRAVQLKFLEARLAAGAAGIGTPVTLVLRIFGQSTYTHVDVYDGQLVPVDLGFYAGDARYAAQLILNCRPVYRGDPVTIPWSPTLTPDGANACQVLQIAGNPTGGTFQLIYNGVQTTASLQYYAGPQDVGFALGNLAAFLSTTYAITAQPVGYKRPLFRFTVTPPGGSETQIRDYAVTPSVNYTMSGLATGVTIFRCYVKESDGGYAGTSVINFEITNYRNMGFSVLTGPNGLVLTKCHWQARAWTNPTFTYYDQPPGGSATAYQGWATVEHGVLDVSSALTGAHNLTVFTKETGSGNSYDQYMQTNLWLDANGATHACGLMLTPVNVVAYGPDLSYEMQQVSLLGQSPGGTFTLTSPSTGNTSVAIAAGASSATVQAALQGVFPPNAGVVIAWVTGPNGGPWTVVWANSYHQATTGLLTANSTGLTGIGAKAVVTRIQQGAGTSNPIVVLFQGSQGNVAQPLLTVSNSLTGGTSPAITASNWTSSALWLGSILGDLPALATVRVLDQSTNSKYLKQLRLGSRAHPLAQPTDLVPVLKLLGSSPGVGVSDATGTQGSAAQLSSVSSQMATIATVSGPATGLMNGEFDAWAAVKDQSTPLATPANLGESQTAASGALPSLAMQYAVAGFDAYGNYTLPATVSILPACFGASLNYTTLLGDDYEEQNTSLWTLSNAAGVAAYNGILETKNTSAYSGSYGLHHYASGTQTQLTSTSIASTATFNVPAAYPGINKLSWQRRIRIDSATFTNITSGNALSILGLPVTNPSYTNPRLELVFDLIAMTMQLRFATGSLTAPSVVTIGSTVSFSLNTWYLVELTVDASLGNGSLTMTWTLGGTTQATATSGSLGLFTGFSVGVASPAASLFLLGLISTSTYNASVSADLDIVATVLIGTGVTAVGSSTALTWTPRANTTHHLVYWNDGQHGWRHIDTGSASGSFTHTAIFQLNSVVGGPATQAQLTTTAQIRLQAATSAPALVTYDGPPAGTTIAAGAWEHVYLGWVQLPPVATPRGGKPPQWQAIVQGILGSQGLTLACDSLTLFPHRQDQITATYPLTPTAQEVWEIDTRSDDLVSCLLYSKSDWSVQGQAGIVGRLRLGPGTTSLILLADVTDANSNAVRDAINTQIQVWVTYVPVYSFVRGQP